MARALSLKNVDKVLEVPPVVVRPCPLFPGRGQGGPSLRRFRGIGRESLHTEKARKLAWVLQIPDPLGGPWSEARWGNRTVQVASLGRLLSWGDRLRHLCFSPAISPARVHFLPWFLSLLGFSDRHIYA